MSGSFFITSTSLLVFIPLGLFFITNNEMVIGSLLLLLGIFMLFLELYATNGYLYRIYERWFE